MFTKKLEDQFSADLLNTVKGILDEAKHDKECECEKCEKEDEDEKGEAEEENGKKKMKKEEAEQIDERDEGKPGKNFAKIAAAAAKKYGSKAAGNRVAGAIRKKVLAKEEVELDESDHRFASEKSKFNSGHRAKLLNPEGRMSYLSQKSYKTAKHAKEAAKFYHSVSHLPTQTIDNKMSQYNKAYDAKHKMAEEVEQIDELSKKTLSSYAKKAVNQSFGKGVAGGAALASTDKETEAQGHKLVDKAAKRMQGAQKAISKLTKEEQDFIDALNNDTLEEGRGRPPKEGSAAWHAKQKQASDDMVALGMQLRKAKSINKKVRFMDNKEHEISPNHIGRFEDHMAARRTTQEKDNFQRQAHKSHADFVKAVSAPIPKAAKNTGEIIKYRH